MRSRWLLLAALLVCPARSLAAPGDSLGGDDDGCIPPSTTVRKCEDGVAKALSNYVKAVLQCHIKAADAAVKAKVFDEESCESNPTTGKGAKEKYDLAITKLATLCGGQCANVSASGVRVAFEDVLEDLNGALYACAGPSTFGGDDGGTVPSDATVGKCEDGVAKALTKYAQALFKCHMKAAAAGLAGKPYDEELCESDPASGKGAKEKYVTAIAKLALSCPACSTANAESARSTIETNLDCHNGDVYCEGTTPGACVATCPYTCLEPFTPVASDIVDALEFRYGSSSQFDLNVSSTCGAAMPVCCPGGSPVSPCGPLELSGVTVGGAYQAGAFTFDVSLVASLRSLSDIPVSSPLLGDCGLAIDTAPGPSPTVQIDFPLNFSADLLRMGQAGTINISNLTSDDVHLNGGIACQIANLGLSFFLGTIEQVIEEQLLQNGIAFVDLCRPCGSTIAQCTPATTTTTTSTTTTTLACGQPGQPCCGGTTCAAGGCCTAGTCVADGDVCGVSTAGCPIGELKDICCSSGSCSLACGPCIQ